MAKRSSKLSKDNSSTSKVRIKSSLSKTKVKSSSLKANAKSSLSKAVTKLTRSNSLEKHPLTKIAENVSLSEDTAKASPAKAMTKSLSKGTKKPSSKATIKSYPSKSVAKPPSSKVTTKSSSQTVVKSSSSKAITNSCSPEAATESSLKAVTKSSSKSMPKTSSKADLKSSSIYQFKITLKYLRPLIWRRLQIPEDTTFQSFNDAVLHSMGWNNSHNHGFEANDLSILPAYNVELDDGDYRKKIDEAKIKLSDYFKNPKDSITHLYDYGDGWEHNIVLEKILPHKPGQKYPICLAGKRACPPDDCGGVFGYKEHLKIISNPKHPEYEETKEWLNNMGLGNRNPEVFDPNSVRFW